MNLKFWKTEPAEEPSMEAFSFGELRDTKDNLESIISNLFRVYHNGKYYELGFSPKKIYDAQFASPHHHSALQLKLNLLCDLFEPNKYLSLIEFRRFALNYLVMGNGYLEEVGSMRGTPIGFKAAPAMRVRRIDDDNYGQLNKRSKELHEFDKPLIHLMEDDLEQEYYGKPYYLAGLASAFLNKSATKFRDMYYKNGNHAGFILYMNDPAHKPSDVQALKKAMKDSKGPGAFKNMFFYAPKGKKDGMQVIPVESAQAQDKFFDIKNVSRDDIIAMHRTYPNLLAVQSSNAGGFGNILEAREALLLNEILPVSQLMTATHEVFTFSEFAVAPSSALTKQE